MAPWIVVAQIALAAQLTQASVSGTIRDAESGAPLSGAIVALRDLDRAVTSDSAGGYRFSAIPPGPQHLSVRRLGYAPRTLHALVPTSGELVIDVVLSAEPVTLAGVHVRPSVVVRGTETPDLATLPDRGLSAAAVRNHPLLAEPDALLALVGGEIAAAPEMPSGLNVRGGASDQTSYVLDGIPVLSPYHGGGTFGAWNPDAIEQVRVSSRFSPSATSALSGVVSAETREPGAREHVRGSVSNTHGRVTIDGPLGIAGSGYLLSLRTGYPHAFAPRGDGSFLHGETGDILAKVEVPLLGGRARALWYGSDNELDAAARPESERVGDVGRARNDFRWRSTSLGLEWSGRVLGLSGRLLAWQARQGASALWSPAGSDAWRLASGRRDEGVMLALEQRGETRSTMAGVRLASQHTRYDVTPDAGADAAPTSVRSTVPTLFVTHERRLGARLSTSVALSASALGSELYPEPQALLRFDATPRLAFTASFTRSHQFAQSLRNPESVVAGIFPVDLYLGAEGTPVPVARGETGVLGAEVRLASAARLSVQAYTRDLEGLLLVAPRTGDPFATNSFATGGGHTQGLSVDASVSGPRYAVVGSYAWQRVRFLHDDSSYVPQQGATHLLDAGLLVFPASTFSMRLGVTGLFGRRGTPTLGLFELDACNLVDRGCELSGTPRQAFDQLGTERLPSYFRVDLGVRKHWHVALGSRDAEVALFGTLTNLLGRRNVLTYATDPETGERTAVEMRSRSPLVVGVDWRF
jgi:hypothetical protein